MILRDLQLDLPYKENPKTIEEIMNSTNCSYSEAIIIDYENNWKWSVRRRFDIETRCTVSMFLRLLGRYSTPDCSKIVIDCVAQPNKKGFSSCMGIYTMEYPLNYNEFFSMDDFEKMKTTYNIIESSVLWVAQEKGWDMIPLHSTFSKMLEKNYMNYWTVGKRIKSPNKQITAELYVEHHITKIDFYIVIRNLLGEIIRKEKIASDIPSRFNLINSPSKLKWMSDKTIYLMSNSGYLQYTLNLIDNL